MVGGPTAGRRPPRWAVTAATAAAVLVVVGAVVLFSRGGGRGVSGGAGSSTSAPTTPTTSTTASTGGDGVVMAGDLGDVSDVAALAAVVGPALPSPGAVTTSTVRSGPHVVGTRPCEMEGRDRGPNVGAVVYQATGRAGGVPAVVLGFAPPSGARPVTLEVLARDGCRLLASTSVP